MTDPVRLDDANLEQLIPLFKAVFGHAVPKPLLEWKYARGMGESWVIPGEGREGPLLHCGLIYRVVAFEGEFHRVAQLVDLMAHRKSSGLSRTQSPFFALIKLILRSIQTPENPHSLAFGFPSDRAMRLGEHLGVFRSIDSLSDLVFEPRRPSWHGAGCQEVGVAEVCRCVDELWFRMRRGLGDCAIGCRDAAYVFHRYLSHPLKPYRFLLVNSRFFGRIVGLAIVRDHGDGELALIDLLSSLDDVPEVFKALQGWSCKNTCKRLTFSITSRFARMFESYATESRTTEFRIMANPFTSTPVLDRLENNWWLTSGDTDYR